MKKEKTDLFKMLVVLVLSVLFINFAIKAIAFSQDTPTPTVGTPSAQVSTNNMFETRTLLEETPIDSPNLEHSGDERLYTVRIGQPSPATGTLFNTESVAWMSAYNVYSAQFYMIQLNFRLNELRTAARLRISSLELQLESEHRISEIRIEDLKERYQVNYVLVRFQYQKGDIFVKELSMLPLGQRLSLRLSVPVLHIRLRLAIK